MKSKDILKVINNLKKVLPLAQLESNLKMSEIDGSKCGTTHCHGGWYAVATIKAKKNDDVYYDHGATKMAKHLGLENYHELEMWANDNPKIWGNQNGRGMFSDEYAFCDETKRPQGAKTLQHIIDHWDEVYDRVKAKEKKK